MAYNVFESTNMASTKFAERIYDAVASVDIENGTFGYLNGLATGESVVYNFVAGTSEGKQVVVADNPAYDVKSGRVVNQNKDKYIIPAGTKFRVRVVKVNDEFAVATEGFTSASASAIADGANVTIDASTGKLVASASNPASGAVMVGQILRHRVQGGLITTASGAYGKAKTMYEIAVKKLA